MLSARRARVAPWGAVTLLLSAAACSRMHRDQGRADARTRFPFGAAAAGEDHVVVARSRDDIRTLPEVAPAAAARVSPTEAPGCARGSAQHLVVTTLGPAGDADLARERPVAIDVWYCDASGEFRFPLRLAARDLAALTRRGDEAARAGNLDAAEFFFRRVANVTPDDGAARLRLGRVYLERVRQEAGGRRRADALAAWRARAASELEAALRGAAPALTPEDRGAAEALQRSLSAPEAPAPDV